MKKMKKEEEALLKAGALQSAIFNRANFSSKDGSRFPAVVSVTATSSSWTSSYRAWMASPPPAS